MNVTQESVGADATKRDFGLNHGYMWNIYNYFEIISKLFVCFVSHVTTNGGYM